MIALKTSVLLAASLKMVRCLAGVEKVTRAPVRFWKKSWHCFSVAG